MTTPMMQINFPGGMSVEALFKGHRVLTDQPAKAGGDDAGPQPFDLFLASLATCAGFYALRFCQQREIDTEGLSLTLQPQRDPETHRLERLDLALALPRDFPEKYVPAVLRSMDQCAVKRSLIDPPEVEIRVA